MQETSHFSHLDASKSFCLSMSTIFVPNLYLLLWTKDPPPPPNNKNNNIVFKIMLNQFQYCLIFFLLKVRTWYMYRKEFKENIPLVHIWYTFWYLHCPQIFNNYPPTPLKPNLYR